TANVDNIQQRMTELTQLYDAPDNSSEICETEEDYLNQIDWEQSDEIIPVPLTEEEQENEETTIRHEERSVEGSQ
ncbi:unnamed protein product, partial [Auanema sp. JU1783]